MAWMTRRQVRSQPVQSYSEQQLQKLLDAYDRAMGRLNDQYLRMMGEHIRDIGTMWPSDVHRLQQIRRMNKNLRQLQRRIGVAAGRTESEIERIFQRIAEEDVRMQQKILGVPDILRIENNKPLQRILQAQARETAGRMRNLSNTTVVSKYYRDAVDEAVTAVQSGVEDYNTAIRRVIREAGEHGMRIDENGTRRVDYESGYSRRLDSAARMNVLDGVRHLNQSIMEEVGRQFGADGVEIDAHMLCAEDHLPYQGGQYSNEEFEQIQDGLQRPFGEWNCRHSWHPILLGISPRTYTDDQLQQMREFSTEPVEIDGRTKTRYQWSQEMRRIETAIRQQKDTATLARAVGDDKLRMQCQGTIVQLNQKYNVMAREAGLTPEYQRTYVQGFRDGKNKDGLTGTGTSITIPIGYKRELRTAQSIEDLKIPMTVDSVQNVMRNIGDRASYYRNVEIRVDADPMLIPHGILGWTSPDGKEVVFYANAFVNVENLAVTIAHESKHLQQVAETGIATTSEQLIQREHEAYNFEDEWWMENGERIMKAYEGTDWL